MSVEAIAEQCQVSPETIELIEEAKYEPSIVLAEWISAVLGVAPQSLFEVLPTVTQSFPIREERIDSAVGQVGLICFRLVLVCGTILLVYFSGFTDHRGIATLLLWSLTVVLVIYAALARAIPGLESLIAERAKAHSKRRRILTGILMVFGLGLGSFAMHAGESISSRLTGGIFFGVFMGAFLYLYNYSDFFLNRWSRRPKERK